MALPLYPYQAEGARWLASGPRVRLLADDMGIGKTAQAIAACDIVMARRVTIICPAVMRQTWKREIVRFSNRQHKIIALSDQHKERIPDDGIVICSFEFASQVTNQMMLSHRPHEVVIVDEAHYLKDRDSIRTKAIYGDNCDSKGGIVEKARYVWLLTGTPAPNNATELYPVLRLAGEWRAGFWPFANHFTRYRTTKYGISVMGTVDENRAELRGMLARVMKRRLRDQVLTDMPKLTISELLIEPTEVHPGRPILEDLRREEPRAAKMIERAMTTCDWSMADAKYIASVRRLIGLAKVRNTVAYVKSQLSAGSQEKFLIFGIHRDVLKYSAAYLGGARILWGGTPEDKRERYILSFQSNPKIREMLCQIRTAGLGVTLTAANRVLIAEASWVPADNYQAIMRAFRLGQKRPVHAQFASLLGSIDERVNRVNRVKAVDISAILD